jgi:hypothetical protein
MTFFKTLNETEIVLNIKKLANFRQVFVFNYHSIKWIFCTLLYNLVRCHWKSFYLSLTIGSIYDIIIQMIIYFIVWCNLNVLFWEMEVGLWLQNWQAGQNKTLVDCCAYSIPNPQHKSVANARTLLYQNMQYSKDCKKLLSASVYENCGT